MTLQAAVVFSTVSPAVVNLMPAGLNNSASVYSLAAPAMVQLLPPTSVSLIGVIGLGPPGLPGASGAQEFVPSGYGGSGNAIVLSFSSFPGLTANPQYFDITSPITNTGAVTIDFGDGVARPLLSPVLAALVGNELQSGFPYRIRATTSQVSIRSSGIRY